MSSCTGWNLTRLGWEETPTKEQLLGKEQSQRAEQMRELRKSLVTISQRAVLCSEEGISETPVLWPPHAKSWLIGKDSDAERDWGQEENGATEDEMAGWHHWLDGRESEWTPGVGDGQGGLTCCDSWGRKESDMTERLNWTELKKRKRQPSVFSLLCEGTARRWSSASQRESSATTKLAGILLLDSPISRTENKCQLFKSPSPQHFVTAAQAD